MMNNPNCVTLEEHTAPDGTKYYGMPRSPDKLYCKTCGCLFDQDRAYVLRANAPCAKCGRRYNGSNSESMCGCGRHMLSTSDSKTVWYDSNWWAVRCLLFKVDKRLPKLLSQLTEQEKIIQSYKKMRLKFIRMKNYMRKLTCSVCGEPVGNRFVQKGDGLLCGTCGHLDGEDVL